MRRQGATRSRSRPGDQARFQAALPLANDDLMMARVPSNAPIGEALAWASRVIAAGVAMALPAIAGRWADDRLGTHFLAPIGLVVGFVAGLGWIVRLSARPRQR